MTLHRVANNADEIEKEIVNSNFDILWLEYYQMRKGEEHGYLFKEPVQNISFSELGPDEQSMVDEAIRVEAQYKKETDETV